MMLPTPARPPSRDDGRGQRVWLLGGAAGIVAGLVAAAALLIG